MKNSYYPFLILFFVISWSKIVEGQRLGKYLKDEDRFKAGIVFGVNTSQMDGDYLVGYDKFGWVGGVKGLGRLTPRLDFSIDFLYSQKGAKILTGNKRGNDFVKDRIIDLTYVEIPLALKWLLRNEAQSWHIEVGAVYSQLINQKITEEFDDPNSKFLYTSIVDDFDKGEIAALGGVGFTLNQKWAIHGRFIYGLTRFYERGSPVAGNGLPSFSIPVEFLRNYHASLQISYILF